MIEDCIISHNNYLVQGDFRVTLDFKMATARFVDVTQEVINVIEENTTLKSTKDYSKFGVTIT